MDLREAFVVERFRGAMARQDAMARGARAALTVFLFALLAVVLAAGAIVVGRDPMGLDRQVMPGVFALLGWLVVLAAGVAAAQIVACVVRQASARRMQGELDTEGPAPRGGWWLPDAVYIAIILAATIAVWNAFATLGEAALRQP